MAPKNTGLANRHAEKNSQGKGKPNRPLVNVSDIDLNTGLKALQNLTSASGKARAQVYFGKDVDVDVKSEDSIEISEGGDRTLYRRTPVNSAALNQAQPNEDYETIPADKLNQYIQEKARRCLKERVNFFEALRKDHVKPQELLDILCTIPKELTLHVFKDLVDQHYPSTPLHTEDDLEEMVSTALLCSRNEDVFETLKPMLEEAILKHSLVRMDITFLKTGPTLAPRLPLGLSDVAANLQHLEWRCHVAATFGRAIYPRTLLHATAAITSLKTDLPKLASFTLVLDIETDGLNLNPQARGWLDWLCTCPSGTSHPAFVQKPLRQVFEELFRAVGASGLGTEQTLKLSVNRMPRLGKLREYGWRCNEIKINQIDSVPSVLDRVLNTAKAIELGSE